MDTSIIEFTIVFVALGGLFGGMIYWQGCLVTLECRENC